MVNLIIMVTYDKYLTNIVGVHLEGPFINPNKLGAQPSFAQLPNIDFIARLAASCSADFFVVPIPIQCLFLAILTLIVNVLS